MTAARTASLLLARAGLLARDSVDSSVDEDRTALSLSHDANNYGFGGGRAHEIERKRRRTKRSSRRPLSRGKRLRRDWNQERHNANHEDGMH
jgi:hypothetical protein